MAERKEYTLLFKLKAALGSNFNSSFGTALSTTKQLQNSLSKINSLSGKIDGFKRCSQAVESNKQKLAELSTEHDKLQKEMSQTEKPSETLRKKFEKNEKQIAATTAKIEEQKAELNSLGAELDEAGIDTNKLTVENEKLQKSYDKIKKSQENINAITTAQEKNRAAISATRSELAKTTSAIVAGGAAMYAGAIKPAKEFESAFAGVKKTVEATPQELLKISNGLRKMATEIPINVVELNNIAESAGQLGIKKESILGFTRVMADLGETTNLSTEEASSTLAKLANITGMSQENFDRLGSTLVALGNKSAATEADIAAMSLRLAGAGKQVGMSEARILSFSSALSSIGLESEAGGTTFSKLMSNMQLAVETGNGDLQNFSKVAGMSANEFKKAFQTDAAATISTFVKGLGESEKKGMSAIKVLDDMGITEVRMRDALLRAAGANGVFSESLEIGTKAWEENKALTEEAHKRYVTTESSIAILKNTFNDIGISIGSVFLPQMAKASQTASDMTKRFSEFVKENPGLIKTITKVVAGLAGLSVAGLGAKLGFLELKGGVQSILKIFEIFKGKTAAAGIEAATQTSKLSSLGKGLSAYFVGVKNSLGGVDNAVSKFNFSKKLMGKFNVGSLGEVVKGGMSGVANSALSPLKALSGKVGGTLSPIVTKVTEFFGNIDGKITSGLLGKVGGVFKSLGGAAGSVLGGPLKGLGSLFGGLFGKVMPIILIISALSALFVKLSGGDISGFIEPLKQAFEQAKPILQSVMQQFMELGKQILPLLMDAAKQLMPLLGQIVAAILPVILEVIQQLTPLLIDIVSKILPVVLDIIGKLAPVLTQVITAILPVILDLVKMLLPILTQLITSILPIIVDVLKALMPIIIQLIQTVLPILMSILKALMPIIEVLAKLFSKVLGVAIKSIGEILKGLMQGLQGIIDFVTGVFTGDWEQAWNGIKNIFGGIWNSFISIIKYPVELIKTLFYDKLIQPVGNFFAELWEKIKAPFVIAFGWFNTNVIQPIVNVFAPIVAKIGEIFAKIWEIMTTIFSVAANWFNTTVIQPVIEFFRPIVETIGGFFGEVWNRITGTFTAVKEWFSTKFTEAWEAIKNVFSPVGEFFANIWNTIKEKFTSIGVAIGDAVSGAFKSAVNTVLGFAEKIINGFINGINGCIGLINKIPGVNISKLELLSVSKFAKGTERTPNTFIAGEAGAELVTNAKGRKVFTAAQTGKIFDNVNKAQTMQSQSKIKQVVMLAPALQAILSSVQVGAGGGNRLSQLQEVSATRKSPEISAPTVKADTTNKSTTITIHNTPTIHVDGNVPDDLDRKLKKNNEDLLNQVDEKIKRKEEDERRGKYE